MIQPIAAPTYSKSSTFVQKSVVKAVSNQTINESIKNHNHMFHTTAGYKTLDI